MGGAASGTEEEEIADEGERGENDGNENTTTEESATTKSFINVRECDFGEEEGEIDERTGAPTRQEKDEELARNLANERVPVGGRHHIGQQTGNSTSKADKPSGGQGPLSEETIRERVKNQMRKGQKQKKKEKPKEKKKHKANQAAVVAKSNVFG